MAITVSFSGQTISWFNDRAKEKRLVFKPPFQRNPVWMPRHKAYLVDTILRKLPVPEIYIQKETDEDGNTIYAVVDGQQRLRTVLEFPQSGFELMDEYSPGRGGDRWDDVSKQEKIDYWNYRFVVREVTDASDDELRDLFRRLNQHTVILNAQEIRNARFKGDFIRTVTELADQDFWAENRIVSPNEIRRMLDIELMAELLIGVMHGPQNKKTTLDPLFEAYEEAIPEKQKWLKRFETAREITDKIVPDLRSSRWRGKSDYYSLFLVASTLSEEGRLSPETMETAVQRLKVFGEAVGRRLSKDGAKGKASREIKEYASAVEKAASDKDRRQSRHEILVKLLKPYFR
jgi:hypothetical protein